MAGVELRQTASGVLLGVSVQPRSRRPGVQGVRGGRLRVGVKEPPERGKANRAVGRLLARVLQVPEAHITLVRGAASSQKQFLIQGVSAAELHRRIEDCLAR